MRSGEDRPMTNTAEPLAAVLKRKQVPDEAGTERAAKHRASQACQYCRIRKVRCDVLLGDAGCTNCRLDSRECIVLASRRGRIDRDRKRSTHEIPKSPVSQWSVPTSDSTSIATRDGNHVRGSSHGTMPTPVEQAGTCDVPVCVTFSENDEHDYSTTDHTPSQTHDGNRLGSQPAISNTGQPHQSPDGMASLPAFISPLSTRLPSEDMDFLALKGAFTVPEAEVRAAILRGYIFSVHPFMPLLDLKPFVEAVLSERGDNPISLLLFQAVMFAGLSSLEPQFVLRLGFDSAKQARAVFYTRVKLLYDFDVEPDSAAVCQSCLLMSSWYSKWNEARDTWHWTARALLTARNMGLHREPTSACGSDRQRRFRRRLWWSLYIRDRMIALGTRRPMQVRDTDFDVTMLTLADFDLEPLDDPINGRRLTPDAKENQCTALMCIELAKLCVCIGHVLSSQYTTLSTHPDVPHTTMVVPRRDGQRVGELERCDKEINDWLRTLSSNIRGLASSTAGDSPHSCSEVHWAMLNMTHLTLVNVLHRTQALQALSDTAEAHAVRRASRSKVKDAARNVTKISYGMLRRDQVRFLGLNGITALLAACLSHMVDIRSGDEDVRDANIFRFNQSMQVLQAMRAVYATADAAVCFLASVIRKAGISVQPQIAMPAQDFMSASTEALGQTTTTGKQNPDWTDHAATHDRRCALSRGQSDAGGSYSARIPPQPTTLLDPDRHVLPVQSEMRPALMTARVNAFMEAFPASTYTSTSNHSVINTVEGAPMREESVLHFVDRPSRNLSNGAANEPFMGFNSSLDFAMDFDPITIDDDFQPETFGFLDSQFQCI
ncbi:hypothetical protein PV04_08174 [Phialophora macrospora]|uniref:Zn(2)-C6 fungal-type domain-containing protein n=1 Tax=Phialophora macrospora TaxID=1851006 RepID=A0A0D2CL28_9EURO|nr:hypothetical protein PV04_08174 [Phialophora macrospora]